MPIGDVVTEVFAGIGYIVVFTLVMLGLALLLTRGH